MTARSTATLPTNQLDILRTMYKQGATHLMHWSPKLYSFYRRSHAPPVMCRALVFKNGDDQWQASHWDHVTALPTDAKVIHWSYQGQPIEKEPNP